MNAPLIVGQYVNSARSGEAVSCEPERPFDRPEVLRWTSGTPKAWGTRIDSSCILVALCLNQSLLTLAINGIAFHDGVVDRGAALVIPASSEVDARFATPSDFLHVHVPAHWLTEWLDNDAACDIDAVLSEPEHLRDPVVFKLTGTLLRAMHGKSSTSSIYADSITLSILARLLEIMVARAAVKPARAPSVSPLEAWRVKMAIDFIDQRIDQSMTSAELGAAVGLSPMHFAARFRAATGTTPHTFILRRRIEHAQTLLATTKSTVADIAFSVGFRTQAHFTTVFRRHVDDTPHRWRGKHGTTARLGAHSVA
ncbi:HTH-type transcriptional activator RhaR [Paraburkholderia hiiakae]|uniref:HTH-type transcriptional activator RhaR n=1 Tax=Paraburkholderia hiiakae TaxID=1081782 RepID=A0ABM8NMZ8_9BURK|nr:AraC family transcriptional regulator [Paraburkholderia hiiakae]CAD6534070.1 HTH-type transcriptional activator RhaR [Paraburkholderia hiiakae]